MVDSQGGHCKVVVADCRCRVWLGDHIADLMDMRDMAEADQLAVGMLEVGVLGQEIAGLGPAMEQSHYYYYQGVRTTLDEMVECLCSEEAWEKGSE